MIFAVRVLVLILIIAILGMHNSGAVANDQGANTQEPSYPDAKKLLNLTGKHWVIWGSSWSSEIFQEEATQTESEKTSVTCIYGEKTNKSSDTNYTILLGYKLNDSLHNLTTALYLNTENETAPNSLVFAEQKDAPPKDHLLVYFNDTEKCAILKTNDANIGGSPIIFPTSADGRPISRHK